MDFDEWKKIVEAIESSTDKYEVKSFKPWKSSSGNNFITIQLKEKN